MTPKLVWRENMDPVMLNLLPRGSRTITKSRARELLCWIGPEAKFPAVHIATRVAALISGEMDVVQPVPVQDWKRLEDAKGVKPLTAPEARAIFIGMDQDRDELLFSDVKGKNPFKDIRVREAVVLAVDTKAINEKIMRGAAKPLGSLIATSINGYDESFGAPYKPDPERAKKLLAEAGYPKGFTVTMDCPNDRYVNDEKVCQAVAGMLARVGIKINLLAQTKSKYFGKILLQAGNQTSMYMLGWTPSSTDAASEASTVPGVVAGFQIVHGQARTGGSTVTATPGPGVSRFPQSSAARLLIVTGPAAPVFHSYVQLDVPLARFHVAPPSTDTSTTPTAPSASVAVPLIVTSVPPGTWPPARGKPIADEAAVTSPDAATATRPGWIDPGWAPISASRFTVACRMAALGIEAPRSWLPSRPHDHWTVPAPKTSAPPAWR